MIVNEAVPRQNRELSLRPPTRENRAPRPINTTEPPTHPLNRQRQNREPSPTAPRPINTTEPPTHPLNRQRQNREPSPTAPRPINTSQHFVDAGTPTVQFNSGELGNVSPTVQCRSTLIFGNLLRVSQGMTASLNYHN